MWRELESIAPTDVVESLKRLNAFYDGRGIATWMANLYDPEIGGFYYSNSARDNDGFLPDLESTNQIMWWLRSNGAFATSHKKFFPDDFAQGIVRFTRAMQSDVDGCFYHPQWKNMTVNVDRAGRDLRWGDALLYMFGAQPDYDIPGGERGIYGAPKGKVKEESDEPPARKVIADFSSSEAYTRWLEKYDATIKENSGNAHLLESMYSDIKEHGYVKETLDFLERIQDEVYAEQVAAGETPTGLFQKPVNYRAVWGLLKSMIFYNDSEFGRPMRYAKEIVATCVRVIALPPDGKYYMNDMMNQWRGIDHMLTNIKKHAPEQLEELYEVARASARELVDNTLAKIQPFKHDDGSFAYRSDGHSLSTIYGAPISLGESEGDVNASILCSSMQRAIFSCLGYPLVPICDESDGEEFLRIIAEKRARVCK